MKTLVYVLAWFGAVGIVWQLTHDTGWANIAAIGFPVVLYAVDRKGG